MTEHASSRNGDRRVQRAANARTALILVSIALVLFGGVIYAQYSGDPRTGVGVTGFAIIGFLLAIVLRRSNRRRTR